MSNHPSSFFTFAEWYRRWQSLADFKGAALPGDEWERRINDIIALWPQQPPGTWQRTEYQISNQCKPGCTYRRGDKARPNPGEHQIEHSLISGETINFLDAKYRFVPITNAFPCVTDVSGGRGANVEVDLLGILEAGDVAHPLICEIKDDANNPWYAVVENLRQLKLFLSNKQVNLPFLKSRYEGTRPFSSPLGIVIAKSGYFSKPGQKVNSFKAAEILIDRLKAKHSDARVMMASWTQATNVVSWVGGCVL